MPGTPAPSAPLSARDSLDGLPEDRRAVISAVRDLVLRSLPVGYAERVGSGMLLYEIPLDRSPKTYNGQPLMYAALAAQKHHCALYLMGVYGDAALETRLRDAFAAAGKRFDMGKSCLRFRTLDDLPLDVVAETVAAVTPAQFIARYEASRTR